MYKRHNNKRQGFTFPEILIVLIIISIFSGVVIISYGGFRNYLRLRNASQEIVSIMSAARAMAINQNGYFRVGFVIQEGMIWVDETDSFGNISQPQVVHVSQILDLVDIVSVRVENTEYTSGKAYILFRPNGTAQYSTIYLRRTHSPDEPSYYYTIKVYPGTGRAKIFPNEKR